MDSTSDNNDTWTSSMPVEDPSQRPMSSKQMTCQELRLMFGGINHYFRDSEILPESEYSSSELGYIITIAYTIVIIFGAIGNMLTVISVVRNPQMRTTRNFFIVNLALSDFLICTITAPITMYTVLYMFWPFGSAFCKIAGSLQGFNVFLSTFSITAIALDRYVLVIFPTKRDRQKTLSLIFFTSIWIISVLLALPLFHSSDIGVIFDDKKCGILLSICHEQNIRWKELPISKELYTIAVLVTQYALPLASIAFAYSRIAFRMRMRFAARNSCVPQNLRNDSFNKRRRSVVERQRRTNFLLVCIVLVFATAWLPLNVFHLLNTFGLIKFSVVSFAFCHVTAITSACLNPVSYAFFNQNFRNEFIDIFDKMKLIWLYEKIRSRINSCYPEKKKLQTNGACLGNHAASSEALETARPETRLLDTTQAVTNPVIQVTDVDMIPFSTMNMSSPVTDL